MKSKILSLCIAFAYVALAFYNGKSDDGAYLVMFLFLPLACIWFSDVMGGYTGYGISTAPITKTTPGCVVALGGWLLLLLPAIIGLIDYFSRHK